MPKDKTDILSRMADGFQKALKDGGEEGAIDFTTRFVEAAHSGHKYAGKDYYRHPIAVMYSIPNATFREKIIALLHDVLEDTNYTHDDLRKIGFPEDIVNSVDVITKENKTGKQEYLGLCKQREKLQKAFLAEVKGQSLTIDVMTELASYKDYINKANEVYAYFINDVIESDNIEAMRVKLDDIRCNNATLATIPPKKGFVKAIGEKNAQILSSKINRSRYYMGEDMLANAVANHAQSPHDCCQEIATCPTNGCAQIAGRH